MEEAIKLILNGYELVKKTAKRYGNSSSCTVYLPDSWNGCEVAVVRLDRSRDNKPPYGLYLETIPKEGHLWQCPYCLDTCLLEFEDSAWEHERVTCDCGEVYVADANARIQQLRARGDVGEIDDCDEGDDLIIILEDEEEGDGDER